MMWRCVGVLDRLWALGVGEADDLPTDLVDMEWVAKRVGLIPTSMRTYRDQWPEPNTGGKGRAPLKWSYAKLRPFLEKQFPDQKWPSERPANPK